jgi:hypothetical protein
MDPTSLSMGDLAFVVARMRPTTDLVVVMMARQHVLFLETLSRIETATTSTLLLM